MSVNWDMITALAIALGAIAIVITLALLIQQMRAAIRQRQVEGYHAVLAESDEMSKVIAHDQASAELWWRASKGLAKLTDPERVRYFAMLYLLFRSWEKAFHYQKVGESEEWNADVVTKPMVDFTMSNGIQEYWALRKRWYTSEFRLWVDKQIKERSGKELYDEQFRIFGTAGDKEE